MSCLAPVRCGGAQGNGRVAVGGQGVAEGEGGRLGIEGRWSARHSEEEAGWAEDAITPTGACCRLCLTSAADAGGCCDCGDISSWRPQGCCSHHRCVEAAWRREWGSARWPLGLRRAPVLRNVHETDSRAGPRAGRHLRRRQGSMSRGAPRCLRWRRRWCAAWWDALWPGCRWPWKVIEAGGDGHARIVAVHLLLS